MPQRGGNRERSGGKGACDRRGRWWEARASDALGERITRGAFGKNRRTNEVVTSGRKRAGEREPGSRAGQGRWLESDRPRCVGPKRRCERRGNGGERLRRKETKKKRRRAETMWAKNENWVTRGASGARMGDETNRQEERERERQRERKVKVVRERRGRKGGWGEARRGAAQKGERGEARRLGCLWRLFRVSGKRCRWVLAIRMMFWQGRRKRKCAQRKTRGWQVARRRAREEGERGQTLGRRAPEEKRGED